MPHFCLPASNAHLRTYKRLYLWDEEAAIAPIPASCYLGDIRLGMPPYHAQLNVALEGMVSPRPRSLARAGGHIGGFLPPVDDQPFWDVIKALGAYTLARDKVLVRSRQHIPLAAGRHRVGQAASGQFIDRDKY